MGGKLTHRSGCSRPVETLSAGHYGGTKRTCSECGKWAWSDAPPPTVSVAARLVCRDHPDQPVNRKGRGCARCTTRPTREDKQ